MYSKSAVYSCSAIVSVMDSQSCDRGSNPGQGKSHKIIYA